MTRLRGFGEAPAVTLPQNGLPAPPGGRPLPGTQEAGGPVPVPAAYVVAGTVVVLVVAALIFK